MTNRIHTCIFLTFVIASTAVAAGIPDTDAERLESVLASQTAEHKTRHASRNPAGTLAFFGITPGMTVVEVLPGGGWYSRVLTEYLGPEGTLIGADYPLDIWPNMAFADEVFMRQRREWPSTWPEQARSWHGDDGSRVIGQRIGSIDEQYNASADAVLFVRALHNLNRLQNRGGFRSAAIADAWSVLKPGGVIGVVQHMAPADREADWADGSRGYMNRDAVVRYFESVGFELIDESDINRNPDDQPGMEDIVWRLPPSLRTSQDDPALRARYEEIGESNRMTLLFREPAAS